MQEPYNRFFEEQLAYVADLRETLAEVETWLYHYIATHDDKTAGALLQRVKGVLHVSE